MEKNKDSRAKSAKPAKESKKPKPPKQKKEKRSVRKQRKTYEKALKKARPEKMLSIVAIALSFFTTIMDVVIYKKNNRESSKDNTN